MIVSMVHLYGMWCCICVSVADSSDWVFSPVTTARTIHFLCSLLGQSPNWWILAHLKTMEELQIGDMDGY
ncbi:hypothetical protein MRB53_029869 [Persea americana]|uniref:Uncharacterized protein n=1 Tax=Persea americana TaxID=3435 RepID=A0ACC2KK07_PERAE|nr:hypothetical protein MRB53_029869 [Persea americana]